MQMNSFAGKTILSFLRQGDYAHAGEEEAINLALQPFLKDKNRLILDVGCGIGGIAKFIQDAGWGKVVGVDIDVKAVEYAQKIYPDVTFEVCNAEDLTKNIHQRFDLIYFFNVLYAIQNRELVLENLYKIAKEHSNLLIFDYVILHEDKCNDKCNNGLNAEYFVNPAHSRLINLKNFPALVERTGWKITEIKNIDQEYTRWYKELLEKIETNRSKILKLFGKEALETVEKVYRNIYSSLLEKNIGGAIIYAKKINIKK